jgi:hypothetical protein
MSASQMSIAQLDKVRQKRIRELERELGCQVVALNPETQLVQLTEDQAIRLSFMERELGATLVAYESATKMQLATPAERALEQMQTLEKQLGYVLVAYELAQPEAKAKNIAPEYMAPPAQLSEEQFERLQAAEEEIGLTLMVYKSDQEHDAPYANGPVSSPPFPTRPSKTNTSWFSAALRFLTGIVRRLLGKPK